MVVFEWLLHSSAIPFSQFEPGAAKLPSELSAPINNTGVPPEQAAFGQASIDLYLRIIGALHKEGLDIVAGTDQVVPGHSVRRELELYVKAGFTPMEAIQAATVVPARIMKVNGQVGTVEVGKAADLILVDGNPLEDISNLRNTRFVVTNGKIFDCSKLWTSVGFKP
jgi:imidazolonepropionase-like amidohydrolase